MYKLSYKPILLLAIPILFLLIHSCRRTDINIAASNSSWTIGDAKEWWYGTFTKEAAYQETDNGSPYVMASKETSGKYSPVPGMPKTIKKYPIWQMGQSYHTGSYQVTEFPLLYPDRLAILPQAPLLNNDQKRKISECILNRVVMIKTPGGNIEVRTISIIPDYDYARSKHFDISSNSMQQFDKDFKGWVMIRQWNEQIVGIYEAAGGKITRTLKMQRGSAKPNDAAAAMNRQACEYQMMEVWEKVCIQGPCQPPQDVPCVTDCADWYYAPSITWEWVCVEVDDNACLQSILPYDQCMCTYYGLFCNGDGNENNDSHVPCAIADSLENDFGLLWHYQKLKSEVNGNREHLYILHHEDDTYKHVIEQYGQPDSLGVTDFNLSPGNQFDGVMHNHFDTPRTLNIFSASDLLTLGNFYEGNAIRNLETFVYTVILPGGTNYTLVITNGDEFNNFIKKHVDLKSNAALEYIYLQYGISSGNTQEANEKNFLRMLNDLKAGITVLKNIQGSFNWQPIQLEANGSVINLSCN